MVELTDKQRIEQLEDAITNMAELLDKVPQLALGLYELSKVIKSQEDCLVRLNERLHKMNNPTSNGIN